MDLEKKITPSKKTKTEKGKCGMYSLMYGCQLLKKAIIHITTDAAQRGKNQRGGKALLRQGK